MKFFKTGFLMVICSLCFLAAGFKVWAAPDLYGSFYTDLTARQYETDGGSGKLKYAGESGLRLNAKHFFNPSLKIEGSFDLILLGGDKADIYLLMKPKEEAHSFEIDNTRILPLFDTRKLYLSYFSDQYTFTIGRQIINYGVGTVFSPIDSFSTVDLQDIELSRKGSDIARIQIPLGALAGIEGVSTLDGDASAVKIFGNLAGYDLGLTGIYKKPTEETLLGFTFKGDLVIGVHGELVEHYSSYNDRNYFEGMIGGDYSFFQGKLIILAEYYYNSQPVDPNNLVPGEAADLNRTFLGERYLFGQASYIFDEIRRVSLNTIYNINEGSRVDTLQFFYNIRQNADLLLYTRYYTGDLNGSEVRLGPKAEYGARVELKF